MKLALLSVLTIVLLAQEQGSGTLQAFFQAKKHTVLFIFASRAIDGDATVTVSHRDFTIWTEDYRAAKKVKKNSIVVFSWMIPPVQRNVAKGRVYKGEIVFEKSGNRIRFLRSIKVP